MTESLQALVDALRMLPSVGEKSAWRMALYLMDQDKEVPLRLSRALVGAQEKLIRCSQCYTWSEEELCQICASVKRDQSIICVVERPSDMWAIEKSQRFNGVYHVLGGVLSPMQGVTAESLTIASLVHRIEGGGITEIIIGLGGSSEAETTAYYLSRVLAHTDVVVSRFARGLAAGMEIEYADRFTLNQALQERKVITYGEEL